MPEAEKNNRRVKCAPRPPSAKGPAGTLWAAREPTTAPHRPPTAPNRLLPTLTTPPGPPVAARRRRRRLRRPARPRGRPRACPSSPLTCQGPRAGVSREGAAEGPKRGGDRCWGRERALRGRGGECAALGGRWAGAPLLPHPRRRPVESKLSERAAGWYPTARPPRGGHPRPRRQPAGRGAEARWFFWSFRAASAEREPACQMPFCSPGKAVAAGPSGEPNGQQKRRQRQKWRPPAPWAIGATRPGQRPIGARKNTRALARSGPAGGPLTRAQPEQKHRMGGAEAEAGAAAAALRHGQA